ncbi:MAG TPA: hypothetical protein PKY30_08895, partial [Myxococcota bacterium]|nr:hypothetical protein [Myxococcota bacterium]
GVLEEGAASTDLSIRKKSLQTLIVQSAEPAGGTWGKRGRWDPSPYVQRATVDALKKRGSEAESIAMLEELVRSPTVEPYTRGYAALALPKDKDRLAWLEKEAATVPGWAAAPMWLAVAQGGSAAGLEQLRQALLTGEVPLEAGFFEALGNSGLEVGEVLEAGLPKMEPELQPLAATALLQLRPAAAQTYFKGVFGGEEEEAIADCIDLIAGSPAPQATELLQGLSQRPDWLGELALAKLVGRGVLPWSRLRPWLKEENRELQGLLAEAAIVRWTTEPQGPGADVVAARLSEILPSAPLPLQLLVVQALARRGDYGSLEPLLSEEAQPLRVAAAVALFGG